MVCIGQSKDQGAPFAMAQSDKHIQSYEKIAPLDLTALLRIVWYGKWVILCTITISTLLGGTYAFRMTQPKYSATAVLQTNSQPAHLSNLSDSWPVPATDAASLNTQVTLLTSDLILEQVITAEKLLEDAEFNRYLIPVAPISIAGLRNRVRHFFAGTSDAPPDAIAIEHRPIRHLRGSLSIVQPADSYIFEITARSRDADKAAQIANTIAATYIASQISAKADAADADIAWLSARVEVLRQQLEDQEHAITTQIAQAQVQEETALDALSQAVLLVDTERSETLAALARYDGTNGSLREAAQMAQLRDQLTEIDSRRAQLSAQLTNQSAGLIALQQTQREADATRVLYETFLARLQETRVQQGLDFPDSTLIAPASTGRYIGQRKLLTVEVSAVLGGLLGLMLVTAQQIGRRGAYHPMQLRQATGRPVFGTISARATRNRKTLARYLATRDGGQKLRDLRNSLRLSTKGALPRMTTVSAAIGNEGEDALAITLAHSLIGQGRVLLIDARGAPTQMLPPTQSPTHDPLFDIDTLSLPSAEPLLEAAGLASLRQNYAHLVIVTAPATTSADAQLLAATADATVLAVKWGKTPLAAVQDALLALEQSTGKLVGCILTQTQRRQMQKLGKIMVPHHAHLAR
jgi:uncharacterized protein involved in exopolysaccharide biosynthesis